MRNKRNGQAVFTFTRETLPPVQRPVAPMPAEVAHMRNVGPVVHAWARGTVLADLHATEALIGGIKAEHGDAAIPVFHRMQRVVERETCLHGELGNRIAS